MVAHGARSLLVKLLDMKMWDGSLIKYYISSLGDSSLIKSILYKNGRGLNPETIVEKVRDKHGRYLTHQNYLSERIRRIFKPIWNDGRTFWR